MIDFQIHLDQCTPRTSRPTCRQITRPVTQTPSRLNRISLPSARHSSDEQKARLTWHFPNTRWRKLRKGTQAKIDIVVPASQALVNDFHGYGLHVVPSRDEHSAPAVAMIEDVCRESDDQFAAGRRDAAGVACPRTEFESTEILYVCELAARWMDFDSATYTPSVIA